MRRILYMMIACLMFGGIASTTLAAGDKWEKKVDMPTGGLGFATSSVGSVIYVIGVGDAIIVSSTVEVYDPSVDTWMKKTDMPTARAGLSTSVVNGKIYTIGGVTADGFFTSAVEEYDTGFVSVTGVNAREKLAVTWGSIRQNR